MDFENITDTLDYYTTEFLQVNNFDSITDLPAIQFDYYLRFIGKNVIPPNYCKLYQNHDYGINIFNLYHVMETIYLPICERYNKIPMIYSLAKFCDINYNSIYNYMNGRLNNDTMNKCYHDIYKQPDNNSFIMISIINSLCDKDLLNDINTLNSIYYPEYASPVAQRLLANVHNDRENSMRQRLSDGKQNPVGLIAILNHDYKWSDNYLSSNAIENKVVSLDSLPDFSVDNSDTIKQIE